MGDELIERAKAIAQTYALVEEPPEPKAAHPLHEPGGYLDVHFRVMTLLGGDDDGPVFSHLTDPGGAETERGHWFTDPEDEEHTWLRLPCGFDRRQTTLDTPVPLPHIGDQVLIRADELVFPKGGTIAAKMLGFMTKQYRAGSLGVTDYDIGKELDSGIKTIGPRRHELVDQGWMEPTGQVEQTPAGRDIKLWRLTSAAIEKMNLRGTS